jgi:hypothetical protein
MDDTLYKGAVESNLLARIELLEAKLRLMEGADVTVSALDSLTEDMGLMRAGEFRVGENDPGDGFSGMRMGWPAFDYNGLTWHLVGVYKDRLMFGVSATDGSALFLGGKGVIGDNGIEIDGLMNAILAKATGGWLASEEAKRYGKLAMFIPDGSKVPVWGMEYTDDVSGDPVISNGLFSTGDLTGWTDSGAGFSVVTDKLPDFVDGYVLERAEATSTTEETLTGVSSDVVAGDKYDFRLWTRENYKVTDVRVSQNLNLDQANPTDAQGGLADFKTNGWLHAGYYAGQTEQRTLLRFNKSDAPDVTIVDEAGLVYYIRKSGLTLGTLPLSIRYLMTDWDWTTACWSYKTGTTGWNTAGAKGEGTDIGATVVGTDSIVAANTVEGYRYTDLNRSVLQDWIDGTIDIYALMMTGTTLSGNNAIDIGLRENGVGAILRISERPVYKVEVKWWSGSGATGTLVRTDLVCANNDVPSWNERKAVLTVPSGAVSFSLVVTGSRGKLFQVANIVVKRLGISSKLFLDPAATVQDNDGTRRILTTVKELSAPTTAPLGSVVTAGYDAYTVALLHMNGADASTTFTDVSGKTWTRSGDAQIDTAKSVFGGASGLFDGTGDYISTPDHADWQLDGGSNSNLWTIDFRIRFNGSVPSNSSMVQQYVDSTNFWKIDKEGGTIYFRQKIAGSWTIQIGNSWSPAADTWYHFTVVKNGTSGYMMFVNGTQIGTTQTDTDTISNLAGSLFVGRCIDTGGTVYLNGWIDELRISKGAARWTSNFTPPTAEYASAEPGNLSEGNYYYKVTYGDLSGETIASSASTVVAIPAGGGKVDVTIPTGQAGVTRRVLYRTAVGGSTYYRLVEIADNTTTTYQDNIADASLGSTPPLVNMTSSRPQFPRAVTLSALSLVSNATLTITDTGVTPLVATTAANANDLDYFDTAFWLASGTYTLYLHVRKETTAGKVDLTLDDTSIATAQDLYGTSAAYVLTVASVAVSGSGYHKLRIRVNGKNASSSDYTFSCYSITFKAASY